MYCRGQESGGIVTSCGAPDSRFVQKKGTGYLGAIFNEEDMVKLKGNLGIGMSEFCKFTSDNEIYLLQVLTMVSWNIGSLQEIIVMITDVQSNQS